MSTTNEGIIDTLTDDERRAAEAFIAERREAEARRDRGRKTLDDFIGKRNERAAERGNPLTAPGHWR